MPGPLSGPPARDTRWPPPPPGLGRRGLGPARRGPAGEARSWAPPVLAPLTVPSEKGLIPKPQQEAEGCSSMRLGQGPQTQSGAHAPGSGPQDPVTTRPPHQMCSPVLSSSLFYHPPPMSILGARCLSSFHPRHCLTLPLSSVLRPGCSPPALRSQCLMEAVTLGAPQGDSPSPPGSLGLLSEAPKCPDRNTRPYPHSRCPPSCCPPAPKLCLQVHAPGQGQEPLT